MTIVAGLEVRAEGRLAVVAGAAYFPLAHQFHGYRRAATLHFKQIIMTGVTTIINPVNPVREDSRWK